MHHILYAGIVGVATGGTQLIASSNLDGQSLVPIGCAAGVAVFTGGLLFKFSRWLQRVEDRLDHIENRCKDNCHSATNTELLAELLSKIKGKE